jgi:hypothetical protein
MSKMSRVAAALAVGATAVFLSAGMISADDAKGTIAYQSKKGALTIEVKHAFLVKGPDVVGGKTIRRLVLSVADVGPALRKCNDMSCSDGGIGDGMTIDFDAGARLNYWFVANDQLVQYSGTARPDTVKLTTDTPQRLAGTIAIDDRGAGGPVVKVQFDATLLKELKGR